MDDAERTTRLAELQQAINERAPAEWLAQDATIIYGETNVYLVTDDGLNLFLDGDDLWGVKEVGGVKMAAIGIVADEPPAWTIMGDPN